MPATIIPGFYRLQFGLEFSDSTVPPPKPKYLTNNGEGNQLTVEEETASNQVNQEWNILPPLTGEKDDLADRIIIPAFPKDSKNLAVSQDVVNSPDEVSLIKNLQVWTFQLVRESDQLYEIWSNLYPGLDGAAPLLGTDKDFEKAIIQFIPVVVNQPPKPVWSLIGPLKK